MVGAEGFEVSFPSDHYAVFFVEFNGKTPENQGLAKILRHALSFPIFLRMDAIPQEFGITGIIPPLQTDIQIVTSDIGSKGQADAESFKPMNTT